MPELKRIPQEAVPTALEKALRYRLLNEPHQAESICLDVLAVDADNEQALTTLLLSLTDQFGTHHTEALSEALAVLPRLSGLYERAYYEGIINERWARSQLGHEAPAQVISGWFRKAMRCYETAGSHAPADSPDAVLRWNACARMVERCDAASTPTQGMTHDVEATFGDDVPLR